MGIMQLTSNAIRGVIVAPPGMRMVVADLSNIEGRFLAWLAGEEWKLNAFRDFDTVRTKNGAWLSGEELRAMYQAREYPELELDKKGEPIRKGHDLYALAYAKSFGITPEEVMENKASGDGSMRQIGKVQELALGYQGGVGAFITFALAYGIDLEALARMAYANIPKDVLEEALDFYEWLGANRNDYGLSKQAWLVCESFKRMWRNAHPNVSAMWKELENAMREAIDSPNHVIKVRKLRIVREKAWLKIALPSGRVLFYPHPSLDEAGKISYMGEDQFTRKWKRIKTYGGKASENATQAGARDVIMYNLPHIKAAGYSTRATVHDEVLTYAPDRDEFNDLHLASLLAHPHEWAPGLPLAAAGFVSYRYKKG